MRRLLGSLVVGLVVGLLVLVGGGRPALAAAEVVPSGSTLVVPPLTWVAVSGGSSYGGVQVSGSPASFAYLTWYSFDSSGFLVSWGSGVNSWSQSNGGTTWLYNSNTSAEVWSVTNGVDKTADSAAVPWFDVVMGTGTETVWYNHTNQDQYFRIVWSGASGGNWSTCTVGPDYVTACAGYEQNWTVPAGGSAAIAVGPNARAVLDPSVFLLTPPELTPVQKVAETVSGGTANTYQQVIAAAQSLMSLSGWLVLLVVLPILLLGVLRLFGIRS